MDGFERLANAIIILAAKDYRAARRKLDRNPGCHSFRADADEIERFFRSGWFAALTDVDGEFLLRKLKEEARAK